VALNIINPRKVSQELIFKRLNLRWKTTTIIKSKTKSLDQYQNNKISRATDKNMPEVLNQPIIWKMNTNMKKMKMKKIMLLPLNQKKTILQPKKW